MRSDAYYIADLEDRILDVVGEYVEKVPRPFATLLSGGFDSSLLTAITKPDFVFRVRLPYGRKFDETRYADAVVNHLGIRDKVVTIDYTKEIFKQDVDDAIKAMGVATTHFSVVPFYSLMRFVSEWMRKEKGCEPHVLSGEGPDEYLGGYARYIIFDELNKLYTIPELRNYHEMIDRVIGGKVVDRYKEFMNYPEKVEAGENLIGTIGKMDMEHGGIEVMEQKMAEYHGVTLHYPYINEEFAEYCYQLPDDFKIRDGVTKWGFRQVCMKYLPEMMRLRSKMGGPVAPVNRWMGWKTKGEFDKKKWVEYQKKVLKK